MIDFLAGLIIKLVGTFAVIFAFIKHGTIREKLKNEKSINKAVRKAKDIRDSLNYDKSIVDKLRKRFKK